MIKDMAITIMWANLCLTGLGMFVILLLIFIIAIQKGHQVYAIQLDDLRKKRRDENKGE